jgi:hypothetical protein
MIINFVLGVENLPESVPFYCMRCRSQLWKMNRDILAVWMGDIYPPREIPRGMGWVSHKCHSCHVMINLYYQ